MLRFLLLTPLLASSAAFAQLVIVPGSLPNGILGSSYGVFLRSSTSPNFADIDLVDLSVSGSSSQFQFGVVSGSPPPGVILGTFGSLRGTPLQIGKFDFVVGAVNSQQQRVEQAFSITVVPPFFGQHSLMVGSPFELPLECPPFDTTYQYFADGFIPDGIQVHPSTGTISGAPLGPPGVSQFTWYCDGDGIELRVDFTFSVQGVLSIEFATQVGAPFAENIVIPGGEPPFTYRVRTGQVPPGLSLSRTSGALTGTPTTVGVFDFEVEKSDSEGRTLRASVEVTVAEAVFFSLFPDQIEMEAVADGPTATAAVRAESSLLGDAFVVSSSSGGLRNWLSVTPLKGVAPKVLLVRASPAGLPPGRYTATITGRSASGIGPDAMDETAVSFLVRPTAPDQLSVSPGGLETAFQLGASPRTRLIELANAGSGSIPFNARPSTANGGSWLSVSPPSGTVSGAAPVTLRVVLDPTGLPPGTYKGSLELTSPGLDSLLVPVTMTISGGQGLLQLSQSGARFRVEQGANPLASSILVQEASGASIGWQASAATISGGSWLGVSPSSGLTGRQTGVDLAVNAGGLGPGRYFGQLAVRSEQASNSPQTATVALKIEPRGTLLPPELGQHGMAFVAPPNLTSPLTRGVFIGNPMARAVNVQLAASFPDGGPAFFTGTVSSPRVGAGGRTSMIVRVDASSLAAGVYRGFVDVSFDGAGPTTRLAVLLVVAPGASGGSLFLTEEGGGGPGQTSCTRSALHALAVEPGDNFIVEQGQPVPIEAFIVDNCGGVPTEASVWARFSNGDDPVALIRNSRGGYSGVWAPLRVGTGAAPLKPERNRVAQQEPPEDQDQAQITIQANQVNVTGGTTQIGGSLAGAAGVPVISPGGAVSAASFAARNPLPPGAYISIFGANLAPGAAEAAALPLPTELNTVSVTAAGQPVGLNFVSSGQINAVLPFGLTVDSAQQIVVRHGNALSTPEAVSVSEAQPAVFTQNFSGLGPGVVVGVRPDGAQFQVGPGSRLRVGDAAVIYCAGLGLVDQPVEASQAAPGDPLARTVNGVSVEIGGVAANVFFAGLAPGFAGLYQINAIVQPGTPSGESVPLKLTVNEIENPTVTVAVE